MKPKDIATLRAALGEPTRGCICVSCLAHAVLDRLEQNAPAIQTAHQAADAYVENLAVNHASRAERVAARKAHLAGQQYQLDQLTQKKAA